MGLTEEIAHARGIRVTTLGGLSLIKIDDAPEFLDTCEAHGIRILGIEGVYLQDGATVPDMDAIGDFSDLKCAPAETTVAEARLFVQNLGTRRLLLDFVLEAPR